jgi:hypothetical protein
MTTVPALVCISIVGAARTAIENAKADSVKAYFVIKQLLRK